MKINKLFDTQIEKTISGELYLLFNGFRKAKLGNITPTGILQVYREQSKHFHWKLKSYGLNYDLLKLPFSYVEFKIKTGKVTEKYYVSKDRISNLTPCQFEGYEKQIFIPLKYLQKAPPTNQKQSSTNQNQISMFGGI